MPEVLAYVDGCVYADCCGVNEHCYVQWTLEILTREGYYRF